MFNSVYLYLLSPLHTGGTTQEGNLVGIAREAHTELPYIPSSSIRGRLRAEVDFDPTEQDADIKARIRRVRLFGPDLKDLQDKDFVEFYEAETGHKLAQLEQGNIWIGDGSILWIPIPSISHGVIWISCPLLLQRWTRLRFEKQIDVHPYSSNIPKKGTVYLKDATISGSQLQTFPNKNWQQFVPNSAETSIDKVLVVPNRHCKHLIEMGLWRQVKVKLNDYKAVTDGSFRYEEAIPPDTLMYFSWGVTVPSKNSQFNAEDDFGNLLTKRSILQIGGQESLGRGFVRKWMEGNSKNLEIGNTSQKKEEV